MEIIGTNTANKKMKNKKLMIAITIIIVILLIASIALAVTIYMLKAEQFKFYVDGKLISNDSSNMFVFEDENVYVSLKDISSIIGYKYYNGGYKQYTEDTSKCYLENINEVCTFEKDVDTIYKTVPEELDYTYFKIDMPIKRINGNLYITSKGLSVACNLQFYYDKERNEIQIYTLPYLTQYYISRYSDAAIEKNFNNQKALLYGLLVVQNVDNTEETSASYDIKYGIHNLEDEEIVGMKYDNIEFIEATEEFIVTTSENKVGIITSKGETRISPQYDALKQIDKDLNLYLATLNNKKGIIERNGKILVYLEYDEIGIDNTKFTTNDIKNKYILFDNAIPVKQNDKWGLFDIKGNIILPIEYDGLGCIAGTSSNKNTNNILIIPDIESIVVSKKYETDQKREVTYYGIVNSQGEVLIPTYLETVYSTISAGREEYTMTNAGNSYNVIEYIKQNNIGGKDINSNIQNEAVNTVTNTTEGI